MSSTTLRAQSEWVLVVNGVLPHDPPSSLRQLLDDAEEVVAVDGGLRHCVELGVWPSVLIGDLDSASADLIAQVGEHQVIVRSFPEDKDATDLELALEFALESDASEVCVVAAFGGRLDHELATVSLLASDRWRSLRLRATDGSRHLWVVHDDVTLNLTKGSTISILPWHGPASGVTAIGMQWPLTDASLHAGTTWGVSNVAVDTSQHVSVNDGVLIVVAEGGSSIP